LQRLLHSIAKADYTGYTGISLIISIDHSGNDDCIRIAESFEWRYGNKTTVFHPENLGLKKHILLCGDYTAQFDAVIVLEDDLFVSPFYYDYAQQAYGFFRNDNSVAGIGLYSYRYNEFAHCPFEPISDAYDNYFLQVPCSWGQIWTLKQWISFKDYLLSENGENEDLLIPTAVLHWPIQSSWKRSFFKYIVQEAKYFVYPRVALTTNFGDAGSHFSKPEYVWQTPLSFQKKEYKFSTIHESFTIYDPFFELETIAFQRISGNDLSISFDLNGTKPLRNIRTKYLISSKKCSSADYTYLSSLYPYENNIIADLKGPSNGLLYFSFGKVFSFHEEIATNRLELDVKRTLPHLDYLIHTVKEAVRRSPQFKVGSRLFRAVGWPKKFILKIYSI
jgi:hypothetical protein